MDSRLLTVFILILCLLAFTVVSNADNGYREVPLKAKMADKDLTFCVTFDKLTCIADFAKGNPHSITLPNLSLGLRGILGFDNKQAFRPEGEEDLKYSVEGNILPNRGTISMWVCGLDYAPEDELTNGQKRGNIALLHMMFKQANRNVSYELYEFGDSVYFEWKSSEEPQGWGTIGRAQVTRIGIKKKQWHQLTVTYDEQKLAIYLNGVLGGEGYLPDKASKTLDLKPDSSSFFGIKSRFYEDQHKWGVAVDDVKVYSRVLSPLEIYNQYQTLLVGQGAGKAKPYDVVMNGVDEGNDHGIDQIEAAFDFSVLPAYAKEQLNKGKLKLSYTLTGPKGFRCSGVWNMQKPFEYKRISGISKPGRYKLVTSFKCSNGKTENSISSIDVPDLSFAGNGIGDEDTVPKIWSAFAVDKDRNITLWNRKYSFGSGPLPEAITVYGKPLLKHAPELVIETAAGKSSISYRKGRTIRTNRAVTFTGTGTADGFSLDYATTVEFDGFIKFNYVLSGRPVIKSMRLEWQVNPENCQFLMTPLLQEDQKAEFAFKYPVGDLNTTTQLWLVSEGKGGFAYSMANDANWIYDPLQPVFKVNKATGACSVDMITRKIKLPESTPYQALFISTPTRPLPDLNRVIRFGDTTSSPVRFIGMNDGAGLVGTGTFKPHPTAYIEAVKNVSAGSMGIYGMADSLTTGVPTANYFKKYWDIPGYYVYPMPYTSLLGNGKTKKIPYFTVPACDATHIKDYLLGNINELLHNPYSNPVWMIYYDLCGDVQCANTLHGCGFIDKFGRSIKTFSILNKRKLVERTVRLCHANNRVVMLHNQRYFYPFFHGLADYFFPGEQHNTLLMRNPYGYTDDLSDDLYRSEYSRNTLGVGVIFLTALGMANVSYLNNDSYTEAMWTMLLMHDVEPDASYSSVLPNQKVWEALQKYQVQSPATKCHLYYDQNTVTSSNPDVRVTYYECPDNTYVIVLANKGAKPAETTINLSKLKPGEYAAREEYTGTDLQIQNGSLPIAVPSRSFRLVVFPPKPYYPIVDDCSKQWASWNSVGANVEFKLDPNTGHQQKGSLLIQLHNNLIDKSGFSFLKKIPVKPGKTYKVRVFVKTQNIPDKSKVSVSFQGLDSTGGFLGLPVQTASLTTPLSTEWQELILRFSVPTTSDWARASSLLLTMGSENIETGSIWFDDLELSESDI
ncbi:MAG: glycoside hydrolase domain-containing protein [Armatimonadota bacterium]